MVSQIIEWLTYLVESIGYIGVAISMFIESFFVPIPSEVIMPLAGFLASEGRMNLIILILIGGLFSYLGSLPFYFLGYLGNDLVLNKFIDKYGKYLFISHGDVQKAVNVFNKYGSNIVLLGRVIPIIRSLISLPAGLSKMNIYLFSIYTLVGSIIWSGILATLGYILGSRWEIVVKYLDIYENYLLIGIILVVVIFYALHIINRKK